MSLISKRLLRHLYIKRGLSDHEIANFVGVDRSYISHLRKVYGIKTRESLGEKGEGYVIKKLKELGFEVKNMNEESKTSPFDILVNENVRIEVKSSTPINGYFKFNLTEKEENKNIISDHRIKLPNGRTKKLFRLTCDFIVFVCVKDRKALPIIIPSGLLSDSLQTFSFPETGNGKYKHYVNSWEQIKKPDAPTSDQKVRSIV